MEMWQTLNALDSLIGVGAEEGMKHSPGSSPSLPPTLLIDRFTMLLTPEQNCVFCHKEGVYLCAVCVHL
jgi:hypothetical protein